MKKSYFILMAILIAATFFGSCKKDLYRPASKTKSGIASLTDANPVSEDTTTVITPFGPRLRSEVVLIEPGFHLSYSADGHIQKIETKSGKMVKDFGVPVHTRATPLHPNNNSVYKTPNNVTPSNLNPNWVEWALATNYKQGASIQAFSTVWKVPSLPTTLNDGQVIYIFDGLQSPDSTSLLQPVLQYGFDGTFGGNYWSVQNFFIPGCNLCSPVFHGSNITVSPGTTLTGSMTKSGSAGSYSYTSSFGPSYSSNDLSITNYPAINLEYGVETLEAYHITQASDYPPDSAVRMTSITAGTTDIVTNWTLNNPVTNYGQHIKEVSNTEIDLYFRAVPAPIVSYSTPVGYTVNTAITPLTPTNTGGNPGGYSVSPVLPAGLTLNTTTGVISGTPTVVSQPGSNYTVKATNSGGSSNAVINIQIWPAPVLSVSYGGHPGYVNMNVTPNIPSPSTGVLYWKDITTGQQNQSANSPYGQQQVSFTVGDTYQFYFIEYGTGSPGSAKSNTVTWTIN